MTGKAATTVWLVRRRLRWSSEAKLNEAACRDTFGQQACAFLQQGPEACCCCYKYLVHLIAAKVGVGQCPQQVPEDKSEASRQDGWRGEGQRDDRARKGIFLLQQQQETSLFPHQLSLLHGLDSSGWRPLGSLTHDPGLQLQFARANLTTYLKTYMIVPFCVKSVKN